MKPLLKLAIEAGPLLVFFVVNARAGLFAGTAVFMVAIVVSVAASWTLERKAPVMPLVSGVFVLVFGGLTLYLADELFIKIKPTLVNALFAVILFAGLMLNKPLLKMVFGSALDLTERGWHLLTVRWAVFFVVLAVLNEVVWRSFSTDFWVAFKLMGALPLTLVFALAQTPTLLRHQVSAKDGGAEG